MTRTVLRYVRWHVVPDNEPDAEPWIYAMECAVCGQRPPAGTDFAEPQSWTLQHSGHNPDHHSYREILIRPWRTWMEPTE